MASGNAKQNRRGEAIICLVSRLLKRSSEPLFTLEDSVLISQGFALAPGKDLAVSPAS